MDFSHNRNIFRAPPGGCVLQRPELMLMVQGSTMLYWCVVFACATIPFAFPSFSSLFFSLLLLASLSFFYSTFAGSPVLYGTPHGVYGAIQSARACFYRVRLEHCAMGPFPRVCVNVPALCPGA